MLKGTNKEELSEEDKLENARTFIQRYKASLCMVLVFSVTQLPKWITSFVLLGLDTAHNNAVKEVGFFFRRHMVTCIIISILILIHLCTNIFINV